MYYDPTGHISWLIIPIMLLVAIFAEDHNTKLNEQDININESTSGKVKIKITENNIEIEDSYKYSQKYIIILETLKVI